MMATVHANSIAIVSLVTKFAGVDSLAELWELLRSGRESTRRITPDELRRLGVTEETLSSPGFVAVTGSMANVDMFDARAFGFTNLEAQVADPQLRLFLHGASDALDLAGHDPARFDGRIGVFAGSHMSTYFMNHVASHPSVMEALGSMRVLHLNSGSHVPTMTSYRLNLRGPSVNMQTACSTGLTVVHYACQSLLALECDMAIAGAVNVSCPVGRGYTYEPESILSPDGRCRPFDDAASGTLFTDGLVVVALRRLSDAIAAGDNILAVIRGSAINNDGAGKAGYTAPSVQGQAEVIAEAHAIAGVEPEEITYVEAHGTGTAVGDPIELTGLAEAFGSTGENGQHCGVGSIKGNVGHTNTVAGLAGLAKLVLALVHEEIPPSINCPRPTKRFDFLRSPFHLVREPRPWRRSDAPRIGGVSSFGMGGTNVHVVVEEAPTPVAASAPRRRAQLILMSARSRAGLQVLRESWRKRLSDTRDEELPDVAFTSRHGRRFFAHRAAVVGRDPERAVNALGDQVVRGVADDASREVVFLFPGQGSQYAGMGSQLYDDEPVFRAAFDRCATALKQHDVDADLKAWTFGGGANADERLKQTERTQPSVFAVSYALTELWKSWGVTPAAALGHSLGEFAAACCAGVMTPEETIVVVTERGRLMSSVEPGAMVAVRAREKEVHATLRPSLEIAAVNGPELTVVAGPEPAVASWLEAIGDRWEHRRLRVSHAFHTAMMDPILGRFEEVVRRYVKLRPPSIPYLSNVTGTWTTQLEATDPAYWARQLRSSVRFAAGLESVTRGSGRVLLEVGPGDALSGMSRGQVDVRATPVVTSLRRQRGESDVADEQESLLTALAGLWTTGVPVAWADFDRDERRRRALIPTYPFELQRYWLQESAVEPLRAKREDVDAPSVAVDVQEPTDDSDSPQTDTERQVAAIWGELLGVAHVGRSDSFFELGGDSLLATRMIQRARTTICADLPVSFIFEASRVEAFAARIDGLLHRPARESMQSDLTPNPASSITSVEGDDLDEVLGQVGVLESDE
jgi:phthiocerol/phenolphthiocerol synthesis type-I polyketide synthase E